MDKELRGSSNGIIDGYRKWLKAYTQGLDMLPKLRAAREAESETSKEREEVQALKAELERTRAAKERFKLTAVKTKKEYDELRDVNTATAKALEQETKRDRMEEDS